MKRRRGPPNFFGTLSCGVTKSVVAAINWLCRGGGLDSVTEYDIVIASERAEFWDPHVSRGLLSNHEILQISRCIPLRLALQMGLMGGAFRLSAQRAHEIGLVNEVVPHERLVETRNKVAEGILQQTPLAVRRTKQCILNGLNLSLEKAI